MTNIEFLITDIGLSKDYSYKIDNVDLYPEEGSIVYLDFDTMIDDKEDNNEIMNNILPNHCLYAHILSFSYDRHGHCNILIELMIDNDYDEWIKRINKDRN